MEKMELYKDYLIQLINHIQDVAPYLLVLEMKKLMLKFYMKKLDLNKLNMNILENIKKNIFM